jgi:hypothetical protein
MRLCGLADGAFFAACGRMAASASSAAEECAPERTLLDLAMDDFMGVVGALEDESIVALIPTHSRGAPHECGARFDGRPVEELPFPTVRRLRHRSSPDATRLLSIYSQTR